MAQFLTYSTGAFYHGINLSRNAQAIQPTEAVQLHNCEFDVEDGSVRTCDGVSVKHTAEIGIVSLFFVPQADLFLYILSNKEIYTVSQDFQTQQRIGEVTGTNPAQFVIFGDVVVIATGGKLNYFDIKTKTFGIISESPESIGITSRQGRLVAFNNTSDTLYYSAIGDHMSWKNSPGDVSTGQSVSVGYKDAGNIIAADFLADLVMIYKEDGHAYKVTGDPATDEFAVLPVSTTAFCISPYATCNINSKTFFAGMAGFNSYTPTAAYGDVASFEEGLNVNSVLSQIITKNCKMWHLPSKKQIWIAPGDTTKPGLVYIYHYSARYEDGRGVFTTRTFKHDLTDVVEADDKVFISYGACIGVLDPTIDTDGDDQIETIMIGQERLASKHSILVMNRLLITNNRIAGWCQLQCGKKTKTIPLSDGTHYVADYKMPVQVATSYIEDEPYTRSYKVGGGSNKTVQIKLRVPKGSISLRTMDYEYLEV